MILRAFLAALGQLGDRRFRRVLWIGAGLALALLMAVYAGFLGLVAAFAPATLDIPFVGPVGGLETVLGIGSALLMAGLSVFLMVPVASAFSGIFLEDVVQAVEDRHYPGLPVARRTPLLDSVIETARFLGLVLVVNLLAVVVYLLAGLAAPLLFWAINGFLLGREYFTLVASRRIGRQAAQDLRRANRGRVWLAGVLMAAPLSLPFVNLLVPVLGAATFTHLFHRLHAMR